MQSTWVLERLYRSKTKKETINTRSKWGIGDMNSNLLQKIENLHYMLLNWKKGLKNKIRIFSLMIIVFLQFSNFLFGQDNDATSESAFFLKKNVISIDFDMYRLNKNNKKYYLPTLNYSRIIKLGKKGFFAKGSFGVSTEDFKNVWNFKGAVGIGWSKNWFLIEANYVGYLESFFGANNSISVEEMNNCYNQTNSQYCLPSDIWKLPNEYNQWFEISLGFRIGKIIILKPNFGIGEVFNHDFYLTKEISPVFGVSLGYNF